MKNENEIWANRIRVSEDSAADARVEIHRLKESVKWLKRAFITSSIISSFIFCLKPIISALVMVYRFFN